MDSDGLPIVGPGLDLSKISALNQRRLLAFFNHFIANTVQYLNNFSCVCEEKLSDLAIKIQRLETTMNILESKLSSIPGLENVSVAASQNTQESAALASAQPQQHSSGDVTEQSSQQQAEVSAPEVAEPQMTMAQHPRYAQYFKMLHLGIQELAVKQKMSMAGLDPSILDNPHAPAPVGDVTSSSQARAPAGGDSSDDFSDDHHDDSSDVNDDDSDAFSD